MAEAVLNYLGKGKYRAVSAGTCACDGDGITENVHLLFVRAAGFINMRKQYLTIGVNGLTDAAEFLGIKISDNEVYNGFVNLILETINKLNRKNKTKDLMFNTEFVPKLTGHVKPLLIDLELPMGQQGASRVNRAA